MIRTVISIEPEEKAWLEQQAKSDNVTMTEMVRRAIRSYHESLLKQGKADVVSLLQETHGMGFQEDGLQYQDRLRDEWSERE
jgi:hypothetical protein